MAEASVVEIVARAILSTRLGASFDEAYVDECWPSFADEARAAISALAANVSPGMVEAAWKAFSNEPGDSATCMRRALSAALHQAQGDVT